MHFYSLIFLCKAEHLFFFPFYSLEITIFLFSQNWINTVTIFVQVRGHHLYYIWISFMFVMIVFCFLKQKWRELSPCSYIYLQEPHLAIQGLDQWPYMAYLCVAYFTIIICWFPVSSKNHFPFRSWSQIILAFIEPSDFQSINGHFPMLGLFWTNLIPYMCCIKHSMNYVCLLYWVLLLSCVSGKLLSTLDLITNNYFIIIFL